MLPGILLVALGVVGAWPAALLGILWLIGVGLTFSVANMVFNAALYEYASTGQIPGDYSPELLTCAFVHKQKRRSF
jgi:hypothetical protein